MSFKNLLRLAVFSISSLSMVACNSSTSTTTTVTINGTNYDIEVSKLVVGMECDYAPFNWTDSSSNDYNVKIANATGYSDGYDVQITKKLAEIMNIDFEIQAIGWDSLITDCQMNSINMVIAGMTDTDERRQSIAFTDEYYHSEVVLIASKTVADQYTNQTLGKSDLATLLKGKNVISQKETVEDSMIDGFVTDYGCIHAAANETYGGAAYDVSKGVADFLTVELPVANTYVSTFTNLGIIHLDQNVLGVDASELGVSIGVNKNNTGLQSALNAALKLISTEDRNTLMQGAVERSSK